MTGFNLFHEARDNYELLIPNRVDGLVLLHLYEKHGLSEFTEEKINDAISYIQKSLGNPDNRNEYGRNNNIIIKLQEFFLWRNETTRTYKFKAYGIEFCKNIKQRLEKRYSPAEIKRLFDSLLHELRRYLEAEDLNIIQWHTDHFSTRQAEIFSHVETLDQQVNESVREFRKSIKDDKQDLTHLLEEIESSLNNIKEHAKQLKDAFKVTYDIDSELEDQITQPNAQPYISHINNVMDFNSNIRGQLEQVSMRIDRIKPKIREFIYEFNQRDFDRKTGLFLNHLLANSQLTKAENGKKQLTLPSGIPNFSTFNNAHVARFIIIPNRDITPKIPVEITRRSINNERQIKMAVVAEQKLFERQRIQYWVQHILKIIESNTDADISAFFYTILKEEKHNFSIAVKVTNAMVRIASKKKEYHTQITKEHIENSEFPTIKLWKIKIQKR